MSNPTSSFGWQMPTSTDLVASLPADFEVFGQAVDSSMADLLGGTTGQVLKKNTDTDMDFVWAADAAGGGKVLQVVNATTTTSATNTTTTYADSNLTATITPTSATSNILVLVTQGIGHAAATESVKLRLMRAGNSISVFGAYAAYVLISPTYAEVFGSYLSFNYLDSPATTSAQTYNTQFALNAGTGTAYAQGQGERSSITLMEIGA
jgi:hypothetical protein